MNRDAVIYGDSLNCPCGNLIDLSNLADDLHLSAFDGCSDEVTDEVICDKCKRGYKVEMQGYVNVEYHGSIIKEFNNTLVFDKENNPVEPSFFETIHLGNDVSDILHDGDYEYDNLIYTIRDGILDTIFSSVTDENQLSLFD